MFTVVICTRNNVTLLKQILPIFISDKLCEKIIVIDNGSKDSSLKYLESLCLIMTKFEIIVNGFNNGVIKARNQGIVKSCSKYTLVLDDDQIPQLETLGQYSLALEKFDIVGAEGQIMDFKTGLTKIGNKNTFSYVGAGGMCTKTDIWKDLGYFDEIYSPAYFEDPDFCIKAKSKGYTIGIVENNGINHLGHRTLSRQDLGFRKETVLLKNRKIFLARYKDFYTSKVCNSVNKKRILFIIVNMNIGGVQKNTLDIVKGLYGDEYEFGIYVSDTGVLGGLGEEAKKYAKVFYELKEKEKEKLIKKINIYKNVSNKPFIVYDSFGNKKVINAGQDITDEFYLNINSISSFRLIKQEYTNSLRIEDVIQSFKPSIIHLQRDTLKLTDEIIKLKSKFKINKIIRTVHGSKNPDRYNGYDEIIFLTQANRNSFKSDRIKSHLIHNGVDTSIFRKINEVERSPVILTHTRLAKLVKLTYNKEFYFKIIRGIYEGLNNYFFKVIGADIDKYKAILYDLAFEVDMLKRFEVMPPLYGEDLVKLINSCSLWLYPTIDDCFPLAVIEAMACGVPIVASRLGGISEMIEDGVHGVLCNPKNSQEFIEASLYLLNNREKAEEMGKNAQIRANELFSLPEMLKKYDMVYKGNKNVNK